MSNFFMSSAVNYQYSVWSVKSYIAVRKSKSFYMSMTKPYLANRFDYTNPCTVFFRTFVFECLGLSPFIFMMYIEVLLSF